ncbi:uncharacterized protein LTR77_000811 [Saxophila tyrrhenica]|uniref:MARVEL domain-containing protein n=1 Tax=Saxophila tyrrhenica TaxID=1690608 RepID=A0AAV9PRY6_9PEZI|nr:hypothetical protein LTR77_000811 [Saxophila tyrrhenica]
MGLIKGGFQRLLQTALYALLFCCAGIILGVYSYFLSVQADRNDPIATWQKAVEGISGAAVVYLIFAIVLTCCLGGIAFFAFLALVLDVLFAAGFIAIAVLTRDGADSCSGNVQTPIGNGPASADNGYGANGIGGDQGENYTYSVHLGLACRLNTVAFAVSIIGAFLFLVTAVMQVLLVRHHRKEKRYGPSPSNNYTSGSGKKGGLFSRKKNTDAHAMKDAEAGNGTAPVAGDGYTNGYTHGNTNETSYTHGNTNDTSYTNGYANGTHTTTAPNTHSGYYTQPTGTAASNPYGYSNNTATNY